MALSTREDIERDAKLCASAGDISDCTFKPGTPAHSIWMKAYRAQCEWENKCADISYEMAHDFRL